MYVPGFDGFRRQLLLYLELVDEEDLTTGRRDALAVGVRVAQARRVSVAEAAAELPAEVASLGQQLVDLLAAAEAILTPPELQELQAVLDERLPPLL